MTILALAALAVLPASAVSFDGGVDVAAVLTEARASAALMPPPQREPGSYRPGGKAYEFECRNLEVPLKAGEARSISLESKELAGCSTRGDDRCELSGVTRHGSAQVLMGGSTNLAKPWEKASFKICMEGTVLDLTVAKDNPFHMVVTQQGTAENDWTWIVEPAARASETSDPHGVIGMLMKGMVQQLVLADKWESHYAGGKIQIRFEIKRVVNNWQDETLYANTLTFDTAAVYRASLVGLVFDPREQYYAEYSIKRDGDKKFGAEQRSDLLTILR